MEKNRQYGYLTPENSGRVVRIGQGQNIAGFPIGIIYIDEVHYPLVPGNVVNGYTFDFPVRLKAVEDLDIPNLFAAGDAVYEKVLETCLDLQREGVRAISSACGFFGNFQDRVAKELDIPVAISSLVQINWIASLIGPDKKIGVLTADQSSLTDTLLAACGVSPETKERLVVRDLRHEPEFSCILEGRGEFDNEIVRQEVVAKAKSIALENPDTGAILLECSDMPPYASAVQAAVQLPVFDFTTLIRYLHTAVCQRPYSGFI